MMFYIFVHVSRIENALNSDDHIALYNIVLGGDEPEPKYVQRALWLEALQILM